MSRYSKHPNNIRFDFHQLRDVQQYIDAQRHPLTFSEVVRTALQTYIREHREHGAWCCSATSTDAYEECSFVHGTMLC